MLAGGNKILSDGTKCCSCNLELPMCLYIALFSVAETLMSTFQVVAYRHDVKLEMEKQGDTFKPGLNYNIVLTLKQMDDTPVKATVPKRVQVRSLELFRSTVEFSLITHRQNVFNSRTLFATLLSILTDFSSLPFLVLLQ